MKFSIKRLLIFAALAAIVAAVFGKWYEFFSHVKHMQDSTFEILFISTISTVGTFLGTVLLCGMVVGGWDLAGKIEKIIKDSSH